MVDISLAVYFIIKWGMYSILACFLGFVVYLYYAHSKLSHIPGPPRSNFFLGNLLEIRRRRIGLGKNIHQTLLEWSTQYRPIFVIWFFHLPLTIASDADLVREVLVVRNLPKDPFGYKRFQYVFGQRFLGRGLFSDLDHMTWEAKRRTLAPAFSRTKLLSEFTAMTTCCENFLDRLEKLADGKTEVAMADEFLVVALETLIKIAFSMEVDKTEHKSFQSDFRNGLNGIVLSFRSPATKYLLWSSLRKQCIAGAKRSRSVARAILEKRLQDIDDGCSVPDDMLPYVFKLKEAVPGCDIEDLIDMVLTLVFGGMETMANHMAFTLLSICLHPEVEKRLRSELEEVVGKEGTVTAKAIQSLPYLDMVMKEALRLHPPTTALTRETVEDIQLGGVLIPAHTPIMVNPFVLQHHPDYWRDPESFQPERFDSDNKFHQYAYLPFSLGPRRCVGTQLAQLEVKMVLARLLQRFTLKLKSGQSLEVVENVTFCPAGGVKCTLTPVKNQAS